MPIGRQVGVGPIFSGLNLPYTPSGLGGRPVKEEEEAYM
jgi:hypothetical protein